MNMKLILVTLLTSLTVLSCSSQEPGAQAEAPAADAAAPAAAPVGDSAVPSAAPAGPATTANPDTPPSDVGQPAGTPGRQKH